MKFWAKVKLKEEQAGILIRSFFKEFNSQSTIVIKGNTAELGIIFDEKVPESIIDAISSCEEIEFEYLSSDNFKDLSKKQKSEGEEKIPEVKSSDREEKVSKVIKSNLEKEDKIPELDEIAKKSNTYEEFIASVAKYLDLDKRYQFFVLILKAASEVERITWANIEKNFANKQIEYTEWDKIFCTKKVAEKFKGTVSIMQLIKATAKYHNFNFQEHDHIQSKNTNIEDISEIFVFEKITEYNSVQEKVLYILREMGLEEKQIDDTVRQIILRIANAAVKMENMDLQDILEEADISPEYSMQIRMIFAEFINDFVSKKGYTQKIKLIDFLKELQKIVLN